jgi:hypothetical protein
MSTQIAGPRLSKDLPHGRTQGSDAPTHKRVGSVQHDPPPNRAGMRAAGGGNRFSGAGLEGECGSGDKRTVQRTTASWARNNTERHCCPARSRWRRRRRSDNKEPAGTPTPPMRSSGVAPSDYIGALPLSVPSIRRTGSPKSPDYGGCGLLCLARPQFETVGQRAVTKFFLGRR